MVYHVPQKIVVSGMAHFNTFYSLKMNAVSFILFAISSVECDRRDYSAVFHTQEAPQDKKMSEG